MYSEDVQKFLDETAAAEGGGRNLPRLIVPKIRLHGKEGKFYILERLESGKYAEEEKLLGADRSDCFGGVILRAAYYAQWKWKENAPFQMKTREFSGFTNEPIELLKTTFGESSSTEVIRNFTDYAHFKSVVIKNDDLTNMPLPAPYDLHTVLYIWNFSREGIVKYDFRGSSVSNWFDYTKKFTVFLPEAKSLLQVKTIFGAKPERNEKAGVDFYTGTFQAHALCSNEEMEKIIPAYTQVKEYQEAWKSAIKKSNIVPPPMPMAMADISSMDMGIEPEIRLEDIPF